MMPNCVDDPLSASDNRPQTSFLPRPARDDAPAGEIRLSEVIAAMSYALDITEGQPQGHAARTCLIGMRIAQQIGLPAVDQSALFYALLLKDLGCSSNAAKMCYLFGADDRKVKRDIKTVDWPKMSDSFKFVQDQVSPTGSRLEKLLKIVSMALQGPSGPKKLVQTRCERGAHIARQLGFPEATATAILHLDEHWNGKGHPQGLKGQQITLLGRILGLAQTLEVFFTQQGLTSAIDIANDRRGRWFDPALVDAFLSITGDTDFWLRVHRPQPFKEVAAFEPPDAMLTVDEPRLDTIAQAFASVVDAKSPWTYKHSAGVADIAVGIAESLDFSPRQLREVRRMGLLHDIGKLGVSNMTLDKPGKLTDEEFTELKKHPAFTEEIVGRVAGLSELAEAAGSHHEKLNGRGYHRGIEAGKLPLASRLLTVADIFEALTAARPYREGIPVEKVLEMLAADAGPVICPESYEGLKRWIERKSFATRVDAQLEAVEKLVSEL
jgi:HD-GYP domain-containing protein (c-di-GMP phosphodiesterase class II)